MPSGPGTRVRPAEHDDVPALVYLLEAYMREAFKSRWHGSHDAIRRDGFGREFEVQVAVTGAGQIVGFAAWMKSYDLHQCITGGYVLDLFVVQEYRGRGVAPALILAVAAEIFRRGGRYMMGRAIDNPSVGRMYDRVGVRQPGTYCIASGRAFRHLATLAGRSARVVARYLPEKSWNDEP